MKIKKKINAKLIQAKLDGLAKKKLKEDLLGWLYRWFLKQFLIMTKKKQLAKDNEIASCFFIY